MNTRSIDYGIFFAVIALVVFGMSMISSVSFYESYEVTSRLVKKGIIDEAYNYFYLKKTFINVAIGFVALYVSSKIHFSFFEKYARFIYMGSLFLLFLVLIKGEVYNGARWWLNIPGLPLIQPTEFFKLGLIIYLAYFLKERRAKIHDLYEGFIPFFFSVALGGILIILQPDFGTILVVSVISFVLFFVGGGNLKFLAIIWVLGAIFALSIYGIGKHDGVEDRNKLSYITDRVDNFLAGNKTAIKNQTINYQTKQGLIAIGSGGFFGLGFGKSIQKYGYLPEAQGDFIFSVIVEEIGFLGICVFLGVYSFLVLRWYKLCEQISDPFAKYVVIGIMSWIGIQAYINMGVNLNIMPLTGITLPFVSYGGSSLVVMLFSVGMVLNISRYRIDVPEIKRQSRRKSL